MSWVPFGREISATLEASLNHEVQREPKARFKGIDDAVGNSPGVRRELTEGIGSLLGWRKGVHRKKTVTRWKIVEGSRKAYREFNHNGEKELQIRHGPRIKLRHRAKVWTMSMGTRREFARTSPKVSGRSLGEHVGRSPEEDYKTRRRECRRLPDCGSEVVSLVVMFECNL
ncbi:hypothetical protein GW17_00049829 [Ensete ventricosum]|nr:hypothetical protein GW17_00049829 [Ensete ventricosum]